MAFVLPLGPSLDRTVAVAAARAGLSKVDYVSAVLQAVCSSDPELAAVMDGTMKHSVTAKAMADAVNGAIERRKG